MGTTQYIPRILPEEFKNFVDLLCADESFPKTYGAWLQMTNLLPGSGTFRFVSVNPQDFSDYCQRLNEKPTQAMLSAFTSVKALQKAEGKRPING